MREPGPEAPTGVVSGRRSFAASLEVSLSEPSTSPERDDPVDLLDRLETLARVSAAVISRRDLEERLVFAVLEATGAFAGSLALIVGDEVEVVSATGYGPELLAQFGRFPLDAPIPIAEGARRGELILLADVATWIERYPGLRSVAEHPGAVIPLIGTGGPLGAIGLSFYEDRPFDRARTSLFAAVGALVSALVERVAHHDRLAELVARQKAMLLTAQTALAPASMPALRGLELAARYEPGEDDIGGDFIDCVALPDGRWALVVGDVQGRGYEAAAVSVLAGQILRVATTTYGRPRQILEHLNHALLSGLTGIDSTSAGEPGVEDPRFVTVAVAVVTPALTGRRVVQLALAGHPRPLLGRVSDGQVTAIGCPGGLLGLLPGPPITDQEIQLEPGDVMVMFTDGLIERRRAGEFFDEESVTPVLARHLHDDAETIADAVIGAANDFAGAQRSDDTAVLVLRATP